MTFLTGGEHSKMEEEQVVFVLYLTLFHRAEKTVSKLILFFGG